MQIDEAIQRAWSDWHSGFDADDIPASSPVFEHGFRRGVESPGISARVVWDDYCRGCAKTIPPALVEGLNRGRTWGMQHP